MLPTRSSARFTVGGFDSMVPDYTAEPAPIALDFLSDKEKFQRLKALIMLGASSKLISEKEISLDGNPGIEMEVESSSRHLRERYYIVNGRILAIQSSAPTGQPFVTDTDRIFESLRLLQ
jgi:hypothetical protein